MKKFILLIMTMALLTSCASTEKMLENGDYEGLVALATRKLAGKKKKDTYVTAIELGFEKLSQDKMAEIEKLKIKNTASAWESINRIAATMDKIQKMISPLLPLVSETGHRAHFEFISTTPIMVEATKNAAALYYTKLSALTSKADLGYKPAAREAVEIIDRINTLSSEYELTSLRKDMLEVGINKIWVTIEDRSYARLPRRAEDELFYIPVNNTRNNWNQFYTAIDEGFKPDYKVVFRIEDLYAEPVQIRNIENNFYREVVDGWDYALDAKGNVAKDSLGNDIRKDRKLKVRATVVETIQTKRAYITGRMEVINMQSGNVSYSKNMVLDDCFTQTSRNYFGDERALDGRQRNRIPLVNCPDDLDMMMRVVDKAKNAFLYEVKNISYL